jgi:hypothetical protein
VALGLCLWLFKDCIAAVRRAVGACARSSARGFAATVCVVGAAFVQAGRRGVGAKKPAAAGKFELTEEQKQEIREAFDLFDTDGSGVCGFAVSDVAPPGFCEAARARQRG